MKKVSVLLLVVLVFACSVILTACNEKSDVVTVSSYEITESTYTVGDTFDKTKVSITATKSDGTTAAVTKNLTFGEESIASLSLDEDNKLTKAGTYAIKVYILEENENYPEFYIGEWKVVVKAKK
ncbi:hypothetical protein EOM82_04550 [bacterium]|nr:hypothetical protein [bacterium]